jgi:hypothetical protein
LLVLFKRWLDPLFASLLALYISRQEDRKFVLACLLIGYALVGLQATREGLDIGDKIRIVGLLDQPNDLGAFLAMYAPVALVSAFFLTSGPLRYALLGCVVLGGWGLIFTQSRAALLAFPVGILVVLFASGRGGLGFLGLVLAVLVWAFPGILPEQATARFASTYVEKAAGATTEQLDPSAAERLVIWQGAANIIATHPLGVGFAQFQHVIGQYAHLVGRARDAHNFYLLIGAELGVGGLLLLFSSLQKMLTTAWAVTRRATDEFLQVLGLGLFAALLTTLVVNCFGSRLLTVQVSTYLWVLSATVIGAYDSLAETGTPSSAATAKTREPRSRFRVNAWGLRSPRRTHSEV